MNESLISRRYAKAILAHAAELGEERALYERMRILARSCATVPQLVRMLGNPMIAVEEKRRLVHDAGGGGAERSYDAFVRVVLENRRERLFLGMALAYMKLYRTVNNISVISITSAKPLSHAVYGRIYNDITARTHGTAEIEVRIDDSLDGGFIMQIDDRRLDASVKGQLEKIKRQLAGRQKDLV